MYHKAVLLHESIDALQISASPERSNGIYVDATLGGAGHTKLILNQLEKNGKLIVFDKDSDAIANIPKDERVIAIRNNFRFLENYITFLGERGKIDGIIADLGVSSHQFDTAERGFSYRLDAPLDMRMNNLAEKSAADILESYSKEQLADILKNYGELENANAIANCIKNSSSAITTTRELAESLKHFYSSSSERKFLGKVFQALRIEVNNEMGALEDLLKGCENVLAKGGRLAVITYHSLEDRIVKNSFRDGHSRGEYKIINKKPILPDIEEIRDNGRSRSAKLRVAERI